MSAFSLYVIGFLALLGGLGYGAYLLHVPNTWIGVGALIADQSSSIRDLFLLFLALLAGVGPVYLLRWVWWRVRASTELTAMAASQGFFNGDYNNRPW